MALVIRVREGEQAVALAKRIHERAPSLACSACGHRDFALLDQPDFGLRTVLSRELVDGRDEDWLGVRKQLLATLLCTNCGHLEQFGQPILDGGIKAEDYGDDVLHEKPDRS